MEYGIGIVGAGLIADFHARAIKSLKGVKLAAILSRSEEKAKKFANMFNCKGYCSSSEFYKDKNIDIVSICTPSGLHLESAMEAINAGKHLIIEKPLEITLKRCDKIINECEKRGLKVGGIFQSRFYDGSQIMKKAVDQKRFGRMVFGDAYVKWFRSQEYYDKGIWKGTKKFDGGGALINQSIHAIDLLQWYMGDVKYVQAFKGILGHKNIEVEDSAVASLEFENGSFGVIEGSTAIYPGFLKRIEISGTRGSAILEEEDIKFWKFLDENKEDELIRSRFDKKSNTQGGSADPAAISFEGHKRQFESFINSLRERKNPSPDAIESRKSVAIILAIYKSAEKGKKIKVEY
ncbi:MAG: Gfo/Idh/MocA family oxidoreductase [Spirochaetes bacterium]|nr:Gfo/Idh/MocA family oxidoreductase [Spirochaetota bacterium]